MKKIISITLNPAFDLHYGLDSFIPEKENYVKTVVCDAGGKGINISRALKLNGIESTAYVILGRENGAQFEKDMKADEISYVPFYVDGRIRENITLHPTNSPETRISFDNFSINSEVLCELCERIIADGLDCNTLVSFSGRMPRGVEKQEVLDFLRKILATGAKVVVDSSSLTAEDLASVRPWLIKPNEQEIEALSGQKITDASQAAKAAREIIRRGVSEEIMISLGKGGAVWSDGERCIFVKIPAIDAPLSTIGAGDSTVAGYLAASAQGYSVEEALRLACAFGTAACMTEGTRPPMPEDIKQVFENTCAQEI